MPKFHTLGALLPSIIEGRKRAKARQIKCPDCSANITENYTPEDHRRGETGYWECKACEVTVADDDPTDGEDCPEMDD